MKWKIGLIIGVIIMSCVLAETLIPTNDTGTISFKNNVGDTNVTLYEITGEYIEQVEEEVIDWANTIWNTESFKVEKFAYKNILKNVTRYNLTSVKDVFKDTDKKGFGANFPSVSLGEEKRFIYVINLISNDSNLIPITDILNYSYYYLNKSRNIHSTCDFKKDGKIIINSCNKTRKLIKIYNHTESFTAHIYKSNPDDYWNEERFDIDFYDVCSKEGANCKLNWNSNSMEVMFNYKFILNKRIDPTFENVSSCTTLSDDNKFYALNTSIICSFNGINIACNNCTFNLMNFSITGSGTATSFEGIDIINNFDDVTILNGTVTNFSTGIEIGSGSDRAIITNILILLYLVYTIKI